MMAKYFFNFLIIIIATISNLNSIKSQDSYYCAPPERLNISTDPKHPVNNDYPKMINPFDWTKDSLRVMSMHKNRDSNIVSPFFQTENPGMSDIISTKDYTSEEGWELVNIGGSLMLPGDTSWGVGIGWPFFVMYNKYRGILRNFINIEPHIDYGYSYMMNYDAYIEGSWYEQNNYSYSSILNNIQPLVSLDNFSDFTKIYYYPYYSNTGFWNWGDIDVIYDPCTCNSSSNVILETNKLRYKDTLINGKKGIEYTNFRYDTDRFFVPGSILNKNLSDDYIIPWYPYYNNILGTFNLLRTPEINYSSRYKDDFEYEFKLRDSIQFVLNPAAGFYMDSADLKARFIVEFSKYPALNTDETVLKVTDTTYESIEIPIGCLGEYSFRFSTPFAEPPSRVYLLIGGNFIKISQKSETRSQHLEYSFNANLTNLKSIPFDDNYWINTYNKECGAKVLPYNLDSYKMDVFCNGKEYFDYHNYGSRRHVRKVADTVEKLQVSINRAKLYDIYPNPANDNINIDFAVDSTSDILFQLYDGLGKAISGTKISEYVRRGRYLRQIPVHGINCGVYYGIFESNGTKEAKEVVIVR